MTRDDEAARSHGNAAPVDITETMSTGAWKSRTERGIPTFPQLIRVVSEGKKTRGMADRNFNKVSPMYPV